jgi:hypothetical protein
MTDTRRTSSPVWLVLSGMLLVASLVAVEWRLGAAWPALDLENLLTGSAPATTAASSSAHPLVELFKLVAAALMGGLVTAVQRHVRTDRAQNRAMEQAQVLLCISGAMMMIIIGNSLARAFGIAGAASIIRFRTPVDDPRDVTILFLLMGLGMSVGLGAFAVAGFGTMFLCLCLVCLTHWGGDERCMKVALVADGGQFPSDHVQSVFAQHRIALEPLDVLHGDTTTIRYRARFGHDASLEDVSAALLNGGGTGLKSVSWESFKKNG